MIRLGTLLPVLLPGLAFLLWYLRTRHQFTVGRIVMTGCFTLYLLLASKYTIFPLWIDAAYIEAARNGTKFLHGVNLVPFKDWSLEYLKGVQGWGNVALGIPFGFLYPFVMPVTNWQQMARSGTIFAFAIELTQLTISLGYGFTYRVIDINDVLLNSTGVMLGYAVLRIVAFLYRTASSHRLRQSELLKEGLLSHIESALLRLL
jgi:glycopeptide antibiotics resistance protein